jgi:hypothetical protein
MRLRFLIFDFSFLLESLILNQCILQLDGDLCSFSRLPLLANFIHPLILTLLNLSLYEGSVLLLSLPVDLVNLRHHLIIILKPLLFNLQLLILLLLAGKLLLLDLRNNVGAMGDPLLQNLFMPLLVIFDKLDGGAIFRLGYGVQQLRLLVAALLPLHCILLNCSLHVF